MKGNNIIDIAVIDSVGEALFSITLPNSSKKHEMLSPEKGKLKMATW